MSLSSETMIYRFIESSSFSTLKVVFSCLAQFNTWNHSLITVSWNFRKTSTSNSECLKMNHYVKVFCVKQAKVTHSPNTVSSLSVVKAWSNQTKRESIVLWCIIGRTLRESIQATSSKDDTVYSDAVVWIFHVVLLACRASFRLLFRSLSQKQSLSVLVRWFRI